MTKKNTTKVLLGAATVAAATGIGAGVTHADTVNADAQGVKQESTQQQNQLDQAKTDVNKATDANTQAQSQLSQATVEENTAHANVNQKSTEVASAQTAVSEAAKNAQSANEVVKEATPEAIQQAQSAVNQDQTLVNNANAQKTADASAVVPAQSAADQANKTQESAQTAANQASDAASKTSQALSNFDKTADDNTDTRQTTTVTTNAEPSVTVPAGFTDVYDAHTGMMPGQATQAQKDYVQKTYDTNKSAYLYEPDNYDADVQRVIGFTDADKNEAVDVYHLTDQQRKEITTYAAKLINSIRSQIAKQPNGSKVTVGMLSVSDGALKLGQEIIDKAYNQNDWAKNHKMKHHNNGGFIDLKKDPNANDALAYQAGLGVKNSFEYMGQQFTPSISENLSGEYADGSRLTGNMANLKKAVHREIMQMTFQDNGLYATPGFGGHTTALLNTPKTNNITDDANAKQFLSVDIDNIGQVHYSFFSDEGATDQAKAMLNQGATTPMVSNHTETKTITTGHPAKAVTNAEAELAKAQAAVPAAQAKADQTAKAIAQPKANLEQANANLNNVQTKLNNAKATTQAAQKAVEQAQQALDQAKQQASQSATGAVTDPVSYGLTITASNAAKAAVAKLNNGTKWNNLSNNERLAITNGITVNYNPTQAQMNEVVMPSHEFLTNGESFKDYFNNIPQDRRVDVNNFMAALVNGMRQALGVNAGPVYANSKVMDLAGQANQWVNSHNWHNGESLQAVNDVFTQNGDNGVSTPAILNHAITDVYGNEGRVVPNPHVQNNVAYAFTSESQPSAQNVTMGHILAGVAETLTGTLKTSSSSDARSFASVLGLGTNTKTPSYIGWKSAGKGLMDNAYMVTPNNVWDQDVFNDSLKGSTTYGQAASQANPEAVSKAQSALNQAKNALSKANAGQNQAQNAYDQAYAEQQKAQQAFTNANNANNDAQQALTQAKQNVTNAEHKLAEARANVMTPAQRDAKRAKLKDANDKAQAAYAQAKTALDKANEAAKKANDDLNTAKFKANYAQHVYDNAVVKLHDDQDRLNKLTHASENAKTANKEHVTAVLKLDKAQRELAAAKTVLDDAKANVAKAQAKADKTSQALKQAQDHYNALLAVVQQEDRDNAKDNGYHIANNQVVDKNNNPVPGWKVNGTHMVSDHGTDVVDESAVKSKTFTNTVKSTSNDIKTVAMTREEYKTQQSTKTDAKTLPQTGNGNNKGSILLGVAATMFGLGLAGYKKRQY